MNDREINSTQRQHETEIRRRRLDDAPRPVRFAAPLASSIKPGLRGQVFMTVDDIGTMRFADPFFIVQRNPALLPGGGTT